MKNQSALTEGPIVSSLLKLAIPIVIANILQSAYQITDTFWVGRLSTEAVAAISLSFPISFLLMAIGGGLPMAGTVLIAQYKGKGDTDAVNHVAAQTLILIMCISLILTIVGYSLAEPIMKFMGAEATVLPDAVLFLKVTFLGYVFMFGYFVFESLMRGLGEVKIPMMIVLSTVLLNLILDPLFIFGYKSVPAMGVAGAAMATFCTQALATLLGFSILLRGKYGIKLQLCNLRPDFAFMKKAFFIGFPASIEQSTRALGMTVMTLLTASFGTLVVAAYGIGIRMIILVIIPALGLSLATSTFVGQNMGAGKVDRAQKGTIIGGTMGFAALTLMGIVMFLIARPMALFFVPEGGEAIDLSTKFIQTIALSFGLISIQMIINGTFRGAGLTSRAMVLTLIAQWVFQFPIAYILSKHTSLGYEGIWWSFPITNVLAATIAVLWFLKGDWKEKKLLEEVQLQRQVRDELVTEEGMTS